MKLHRSIVGLEHQVTFELAFAHRTREILLFSHYSLDAHLAGRVIQRGSLHRRWAVEMDPQNQQQNADHQGCANECQQQA